MPKRVISIMDPKQRDAHVEIEGVSRGESTSWVNGAGVPVRSQR